MRHTMLERLIPAAAAVAAFTAAASFGFTATPVSASTSANPAPLPCSPKKIDNLTYRGGYVLHYPQVTLIFWGPWWRTSPKAPTLVTKMQNLFTGLTGSSWAETVTQYCESGGGWPNIDNFGVGDDGGNTLLAGTMFDSTKPPAAPTDQNLTDEAEKMMSQSLSVPPFAGVPMIFTPPGVVPQADGHHDCGHHSWGYTSDRLYWRQWADVPYGGLISQDPASCTLRWPNSTPVEALSVTAGHEWAETATDPFVPGDPNMTGFIPAWRANVLVNGHVKHPEIADLCGAGYTDPNGNPYKTFWLPLSTGNFLMQELWSNEAGPSSLQGECVQGS